MTKPTTPALPTVDLPLDRLWPNPWNPNEQNERQFAAELESLCLFGVVLPIVVRAHPERADAWQIIDGEHRWKGMRTLTASPPATMHPHLLALIDARSLPAVVLDIDDDLAKKLTVVLNETRGRANPAALASLVADLSTGQDFDSLLRALPYRESELNDLLTVAAFDWEGLAPVSPGELDPEPAPVKHLAVNVLAEDVDVWRALVVERRGIYTPENATAVLSDLIHGKEPQP